MSSPDLIQHCVRCGATAERQQPNLIPDGWDGTIRAGVCPNCQLAEWHPHCTSLVTIIPTDGSIPPGQRVDRTVDWPREEWDLIELERCDYIDPTIAVTYADENRPTDWRCPRCGGTSFEWVQADYPHAGPAMSNRERNEKGVLRGW